MLEISLFRTEYEVEGKEKIWQNWSASVDPRAEHLATLAAGLVKRKANHVRGQCPETGPTVEDRRPWGMHTPSRVLPVLLFFLEVLG